MWNLENERTLQNKSKVLKEFQRDLHECGTLTLQFYYSSRRERES
jgi:hypothetical protein